jgi:hypothetical protein
MIGTLRLFRLSGGMREQGRGQIVTRVVMIEGVCAEGQVLNPVVQRNVSITSLRQSCDGSRRVKVFDDGKRIRCLAIWGRRSERLVE